MRDSTKLAGSVRSGRGRFARIGYLMLLPALAVFALFLAYPLVHTLVLSLYAWSPVSPRKLYEGLGNYAELLRDPGFHLALRNNVHFVTLSLALQMPLALLLAVGLNSATRWHRWLRTLFFSPFVLPVVAVGLIWQLIYEPSLGALNAFLTSVGFERYAIGWLGEETAAIFAIIAVSSWRYVGFHMMVILAGLQGVPEEIYEAARLDGAGRWQILTLISLPSLRRILLVDALLVTVGSVKMFDLVQVMTGGGPGAASEVLATYMFRSAFTYNRMGYAAAVAVVLLALTLLLTVLYLRASGREAEGESRVPFWTVLVGVAGLGGGAAVVGKTLGWPPPLTEVALVVGGSAAGLLLLWPVSAGIGALADRLPHRLAERLSDGALTILGAVFFLPILWALLSAFKPQNELLLSPWSWPREWAWGNFAEAWAGGVGRFLANSVGVTAVAVALMLALSAPAAYALARLRVRGATALFGLLLTGLLLPVHAVLIPLYQFNNALHLREYAAILGPYVAFGLPLAVLLLRAYFQGLPEELSEAARLEGAGDLRILWSILLPLARPAVATVAVFQAAWVWNELPLGMVFLTEKVHMTLPVGLLNFRGEHSNNWAVVMAGVAISLVPILALCGAFQRHVVRGLTAGAGK